MEEGPAPHHVPVRFVNRPCGKSQILTVGVLHEAPAECRPSPLFRPIFSLRGERKPVGPEKREAAGGDHQCRPPHPPCALAPAALLQRDKRQTQRFPLPLKPCQLGSVRSIMQTTFFQSKYNPPGNAVSGGIYFIYIQLSPDSLSASATSSSRAS